MSYNNCQPGLIYSYFDCESATFDLAIKYLQIQTVRELLLLLTYKQTSKCNMPTGQEISGRGHWVAWLFCQSNCDHPQTFSFKSSTESSLYLYVILKQYYVGQQNFVMHIWPGSLNSIFYYWKDKH